MKAAFLSVTLVVTGAGLVWRLTAHLDEKGADMRRGKRGRNEAAQETSRFQVTFPANQKSGQQNTGAAPLKQSSTVALKAPEAESPGVEERSLSAATEQKPSSGPKPSGVRAKLPANSRPPETPLVFREVDAAAVPLEPAQAAAAAAVQDIFADQFDPEPADPSAADYGDRWRHEQPVADQRLRAMIGAQAYARWQREAYIRSRKATSDQH